MNRSGVVDGATGLLITEDEEEDTTVEPNAAAVRGTPRIPPPSGSATTRAEPHVIGVEVVERPRLVLSWPAAIAAGVIGFVLGGVFFGQRGPAVPPVASSSTPIITTAPPPPPPPPVKTVAAPPPPPPAPVLEAAQPAPAPSPPPRRHPRKVVEIGEVVLTTPDPSE